VVPIRPPITRASSDPGPAPAFKFLVELFGIIVAEFKECTGLGFKREAFPVKEGGVNDHVHYLPGRTEYTNIVLKYGVAESQDLWDWYYKYGLYDLKVRRADLTILLRNVRGDVVRCWSVMDAFPVRWEGPQLNTESSQVAIETLEIAHHGLKLIKV